MASETPDVDVSLIPEWRRAQLPIPQPAALISYDGENFIASHPDSGIALYDSFEEACLSNIYYVFDRSIYAHGKRFGLGVLIQSSTGAEILRTPKTVEMLLARVADDYRGAMERFKNWLDNKTDVRRCWEFVSAHPAYWLLEDQIPSSSDPVTTVRIDCDGDTIVAVENGPLTQYGVTLDTDTIGEGATFEAALADHAKLLSKHYLWSGERRR